MTAPEVQRQDPHRQIIAASILETASWVIREKATGTVIMETFDPAKVKALNVVKYEAVPIHEYLASLNKALNQPRVELELSESRKRTQLLYAATAQMVALTVHADGLRTTAIDARMAHNDAEAALKGGYGVCRPEMAGPQSVNPHEQPLRQALHDLLAVSGGVPGFETSSLDPVLVRANASLALSAATASLIDPDAYRSVDEPDQATDNDRRRAQLSPSPR